MALIIHIGNEALGRAIYLTLDIFSFLLVTFMLAMTALRFEQNRWLLRTGINLSEATLTRMTTMRPP